MNEIDAEGVLRRSVEEATNGNVDRLIREATVGATEAALNQSVTVSTLHDLDEAVGMPGTGADAATDRATSAALQEAIGRIAEPGRWRGLV